MRLDGLTVEQLSVVTHTDGPAGAGPAPDLPPLPREDYVPGIVCHHVRFGQGVIHRVDDHYGIVEVHFRRGAGVKLLYIETCVTSGLLRQPPGLR